MPTIEDLLVGKKPLQIRSVLSAEECAHRLNRLYQPSGGFTGIGIRVWVYEQGLKEYFVTVQAVRGDVCTAEFVGEVKENAAGEGVLSGHTTFDLRYLLAAAAATLVILVLVLIDALSSYRILIAAIGGALSYYVWSSMFSDRRALVIAIETAMHSRRDW